MIQIEGERGQETGDRRQKKYTHSMFSCILFFHCISQIKKKSFSLSNSLFYKEKRGLNGVPPI